MKAPILLVVLCVSVMYSVRPSLGKLDIFMKRDKANDFITQVKPKRALKEECYGEAAGCSHEEVHETYGLSIKGRSFWRDYLCHKLNYCKDLDCGSGTDSIGRVSRRCRSSCRRGERVSAGLSCPSGTRCCMCRDSFRDTTGCDVDM